MQIFAVESGTAQAVTAAPFLVALHGVFKKSNHSFIFGHAFFCALLQTLTLRLFVCMLLK